MSLNCRRLLLRDVDGGVATGISMQHLRHFDFFLCHFFSRHRIITPLILCSVAHSLLPACSPATLRLCLAPSLFRASLRLEAEALRRDVITDAALMSACVGERAVRGC